MAAPAAVVPAQQAADVDYLITNVLMPVDADEDGNPMNGYARFTVRMSRGVIESVSAAARDGQRTHAQHRGMGQRRYCASGVLGSSTHGNRDCHDWRHSRDGSPVSIPLYPSPPLSATLPSPSAAAPRLSKPLHSSPILLHRIKTYIRDLSDLEAAVRAYKHVGIRAFIAPMLGDLDVSMPASATRGRGGRGRALAVQEMVLHPVLTTLPPRSSPLLSSPFPHYQNYFPLVPDACERNERARQDGVCPGAMGTDGYFREQLAERQEANTERVLSLWREAAQKFHDPEGGINIVIGPVQNWGASDELIRRAVDIRKEFGLCGHIHLLESRMQKLQSRSRYPDGGCVKLLKDIGWLSLLGTSCAHCVWLSPLIFNSQEEEEEQAIMAECGAVAVHNPEDEEQAIMAECGAVAVHNPVSNLRLGSGVAPIRAYLDKGITVAIGCDGQCSNDSQDMLEAVKMACIVNPLTTPEYRHWLSPREVLRMAAEGGAVAVGMKGRAGQIKPGYVADAVLVDLTALSMLPRADPVGQLVLTRQSRPCGATGAHQTKVRGHGRVSEVAWVDEAVVERQHRGSIDSSGGCCVGGPDCSFLAASSRPCGATGAHQTKVQREGGILRRLLGGLR
ncbi:unnamed protein product [Closterium sp. NIES-65]|nr:unnamed protein product [Closterium sp. NIES-65]